MVAALCFLAGLLAHGLWPALRPVPQIRVPLTVSICELARNPSAFEGQLVRIRAVLYRDAGPILYDPTCGWAGANPTAISVAADTEDVNISPLPEWATYTSFCGNDPHLAAVTGLQADVIVVGIFRASAPAANAAYGEHQPRIIAKGVYQLSPTNKQR